MINAVYALIPTDGHKSFYGKARVMVEDGVSTLYSYGTKIMDVNKDGSMVRYWDDWSATTGRHIKAFCGLNKAGYFALPMEE